MGAAGYGAGYGYSGYAAPAPVAAGLGYAGYAPYGYNGPLNLNAQLVAHPNGAVAAARADHLASKGIAYAAAAPAIAGLGYTGYAPGYAAGYGYAGPLNLNTQLIAHPNGAVVPVDEPAAAHARAA